MALRNSPSTFTAITGSIKMAGTDVGNLQDITWTENNNLIRVKGIGSAADIRHVDGVVEYELSVRRAFLDADFILTLMAKADTTKLVGTDKLYASMSAMANQDVLTDADRKKWAQAIIDTQITTGVKVAGLLFDVVVSNAAGQTFRHFYECKINTRRASVSTGTVIIMEDATIWARYADFGSSAAAASELTPLI